MNVVTGDLQVASLKFVCLQDTNDFNIREFIDLQLPRKYENLVIDTYDIDERSDDPGVWDVRVGFKLPEDQQSNHDGQPVRLQFSTGGGTQTLKYSQRTLTKLLCPNVNGKQAPDQKGAVNVGESGPEGVEYPVPALEFGYTYKVLPNTVDVFALYAATGKWNANYWRGFAPGELMFMGVDGTIDLTQGGDLTYKFSAKANRSNLRINGSKSFSARGWDYVWTLNDKREDAAAKKVTIVPIAVYVEEMVGSYDFNFLGIL